MKIHQLFLLFVLFSAHIFAQSDLVIGSVTNESGDKLPGASLYNLRTDQIVVSDKLGNFAIVAKPFDEIRISRGGFERRSIVVNSENFAQPLEVRLKTIPIEIEELNLGFRPSGVLKKDVARLNRPARVVALNKSLNLYMKSPMTEVAPKATVPSAFSIRKPGDGQVPLLSFGSGGGGIIGAIGGLIKKSTESPKTTADYEETQVFYQRIKNSIDMSYYTAVGMDEYDFDLFLAEMDKRMNLAKNYRKNFNKAAIEMSLRTALVDYLKNHSFSKVKNES